jgi:hypothetical protein
MYDAKRIRVTKVKRYHIFPYEGQYKIECETDRGHIFVSQRSYSEQGCDVIEARIKERGTVDPEHRYTWVGIQR